MATGDTAASALAFAQALGQLQKARMADAEAAKFAASTDSTLAQAKAAMAAAAREAAAAAQAEAAAQKAAAQATAQAAKEAATLAAQWAKERAAAERQAAKEAASAQRAAAKEQDAAQKAIAKAAKEAAKAAKEQAKEQKKAAKEAEEAMLKQRAATDAARGPTREFGESAAKMGYGMMAAQGPIGKVQNLMQQLGPQGQAAAAAIGMATIAITALVGVITGGMAMAIGVVEKMTQRLSVFSALGGSAAAGKATLAMVQKLSDKLPFSTDQLSQWAQAMQRAGYEGKALETATKAIAAAAAINPEGGADAARAALEALSGGGQEAAKFLKSMQTEGKAAERKLREMGLSMADLGGKTAVAKMNAKQLQSAMEAALLTKAGKAGGPLEAMNNTWEAIITKAKAGFGSLFGGLSKSVEPFMGAVRNLFSMFNRGSPTMAALRAAITTTFGTLFSWATKAVGVVQSVFQQLVIAALKVRIAVNPLWLAVRQLGSALGELFRATGLASSGGGVLKSVLSAAAFTIKSLFLGAIFVVTMFVRGVVAMVRGVTTAINIVKGVFRSFTAPNLSGAAGNMITSFVSGITSKIGSVIGAMKGMGQAAKSALFGALGIASPSRVALEAAGNVTSTFSDKVDDGKADTQRAFSGMVKVPPPGKGAGGGAGVGAGARLEALLERLCMALEASPGVTEVVQAALAEAAQEGGLA